MIEINEREWDQIEENDGSGYKNPPAGGYAARIVSVYDNEEEQYISIKWDYADGEFKGYNQKTFERAGFWPSVRRQYYTPNSLPYFKAFKTAVETSNRNYQFSTRDVQGLVGKYVGVVTMEKEYRAKDGSIKTGIEVHQFRSGKAIRDGDFKVPPLKRLDVEKEPAPSGQFLPLDEDDGDLPF